MRRRVVPPPPERTPSRPGPGPVPDAVLRSLDLAVLWRVQSLVPGDHLTPQVGSVMNRSPTGGSSSSRGSRISTASTP